MTGSRMSKREIAYHKQRRNERIEWDSLKQVAKANCDASSDLDELTELARTYLLAELDLYKHQYNQPEQVAKLLRRANSQSYCRAWAINELARRLMSVANETHNMTPEERATYESRVEAESASLASAINAMIRSAFKAGAP